MDPIPIVYTDTSFSSDKEAGQEQCISKAPLGEFTNDIAKNSLSSARKLESAVNNLERECSKIRTATEKFAAQMEIVQVMFKSPISGSI